MTDRPSNQPHTPHPLGDEGGESADRLVNPDTWLDEHGNVLFRFAMARVRDPDLAEELVQETLVAGLKARGSFAHESNIQTWLVGILRRKIVDYFRVLSRERKQQQTSEETFDYDQHFSNKGHWKETLGKWPKDPSAALEHKEFWGVFDGCMSKLPKHMAQAFLLREKEQLSTEEICNELGISPSNLAVRLHRARLQLRKCLERNWFQK